MHQQGTRLVVLVALALLTVSVWPVRAQLVVHDPAVTLRNSITATVQELVFNMQREQRRQIRRMARRLSLFTNLDGYTVEATPRWRIHQFLETETVLFARDYHAALNYGDASGRAYLGVTQPLLSPGEDDPFVRSGPAWRAFMARLATVNVADAVAISG